MDKTSPLYKKMKKALNDERANYARLASEIEQSAKDIQAYERLLREPAPEKQPELLISGGSDLVNPPKHIRRKGASDAILKVIDGLPNKFMVKDIRAALKLVDGQFPRSTISAVVRKMYNEKKLEESGKAGKEIIYNKVK